MSPAAPRTVRRTATAASAGILVALLGACTGDSSDSASSHDSSNRSSATGASAAASAGGTAATLAGTDALTSVRLTAADGVDAGAAEGHSVQIPRGWTAQVWAKVDGARVAAWAPDGRLAVTSPGSGSVVLLQGDGDDRAASSSTLLSGLEEPQGIAFTSYQGKATLVVGESSRITAYDYADGKATGRRVLVDGLPTGGHSAKAVAVHDGTVYYSVGSSGNRVPEDRRESPERATIARVGLDGKGNRTMATGVRNGFGLGIAPDGTVFTAVNQSDNQTYPFRDSTGDYGKVVQDFVNDNPIEQVTRVSQGTELGWPYCVPDTRNNSDATNVPYVNDPETNADGAELDCAKATRTMVGLPAHSAPLGVSFTDSSDLAKPYASGALVAAHGSWNREPPQQPYVAYLPWNSSTKTLGRPQALITGFQNDDGSRWGRPVMALAGAGPSIYVTDDEAGLVYRITPN